MFYEIYDFFVMINAAYLEFAFENFYLMIAIASTLWISSVLYALWVGFWEWKDQTEIYKLLDEAWNKVLEY